MFNVYNKKKEELLTSDSCRFHNIVLFKELESVGGVYRIFSIKNSEKTLYVGKTKDIKRRLYSNLFRGSGRHTLVQKLINANTYKKCIDEMTVRAYLKCNCVLQYIVEERAKERSFFEHYLIAMLRPSLND